MIAVFTNNPGPRLQYVCNFIFTTVLGTPFEILVNKNDAENFQGILINYSFETLNAGLKILPAGLLSEHGNVSPVVGIKEKLPVLFPDAVSATGFDVFSAVFFMISRYEEYQSFTPDQHNRFPATESLAYKHNFLHLPVVDHWINELSAMLRRADPSLVIKEKTFSYRSTIDIDNAFAYKGKGKVRMFGALAKEALKGKSELVKERISYLKGESSDPFDHYHFQLSLSNESRIPLTYFILYTEKGKYDVSLPPGNESMDNLVKLLAKNAGVGIHPSYFTSENTLRLKKEISDLSLTAKKKIFRSRQHFLRMRFPETQRVLIENGITEDYSIGFSTHNGFRAGTSSSFNFYDLKKEEETNLKLVPFQIMDSVFYDQKKISAEDAMKEIMSIADEVIKLQGELVSVWHDRSFDDTRFPGWKSNYIKLHEFCSGVKVR